jgi:chemotaxis protein methyltransferase WspC
VNLAPVESLLRDRIGFDPQSLGPAALPRAVGDRIRARRIADADDYARTLAADAAEWAALLGHLLVAESWFFRGGRPLFDHLAAWIRARTGNQPVRILSMPCGTGEEPYSLAIALREGGVPGTRFRIDCVDLSTEHVCRARAGVFNAFAFREAGPDPRDMAFLQRGESQWELLPRYRESVHFRTGNAIAPNLMGDEAPFDLILSRNLFIYLTPDGCKRAMENLERLLAPDGRLCLTPAEADRLPAGRFVLDGPVGLALYRRTSDKGSGVTPQPSSGLRSGTVSITSVRATPPAALEREVRGEPAPPLSVLSPIDVARSLADAGRLDEAQLACERLLRADPTADGFALLGVIHVAAKRHAEASAAFRKALYLEPDHADALTHMIVLHERRGESEPAAALTRRLARVRRREPA